MACQRVPLAAHRHLEGTFVVQGVSIRALSVVPAPQDQGLPRRVRRRVRPAGDIEFNNGVQHAARRPDGGGTSPTSGHDPRVRSARRRQRPPPGRPGYPDLGQFTGETIHSHHYIDPQSTRWTGTSKRILVVGIGNSAADITVEFVLQDTANTVKPLSTRSSAWIVPKYIAQATWRHWRTSPYIPLSLAAPRPSGDGSVRGRRPGFYGLLSRITNSSSASHAVGRTFAPGSGDVIPKPNVSATGRDTVHFEDGTSAVFDAIIYATGYNITFRSSTPSSSAPRQRHPASTSRMFSRHRQSGVHPDSPRPSRRCSLHRMPGQADGRLRRSAAMPRRRSPRWNG